MRKKLLCCFLVVLMGAMSVFPAFADDVRCSISHSGRTVNYSGYTRSTQTEDTIGVTIKLMEKRDSVWYRIGTYSKSLDNANYVSKTGSTTVTGGHYYKLITTHSFETNGVYSETKTTSAEIWIP